MMPPFPVPNAEPPCRYTEHVFIEQGDRLVFITTARIVLPDTLSNIVNSASTEDLEQLIKRNAT